MKQGEKRTPRKRITRAAREQLMLDAAEQVFGEHGFAAASMDDLARASGVTKGLVYEYFGSKESLYVAFYERVRGRLFDAIEASLEDIPPGWEHLHVVIETYFAFLDAHRGQRWLIYTDVPQDTANALRLLNSESIARMLRGALPVELPQTDLELLAQALTGSGEQVGRWWLDEARCERAEVVERFERMARALITDAVRRAQEAGR